jgi:hypothetical protein
MTAAFDQLADQPRWVAWRNERRGDRTTKVPHSPAGGLAKANDPRTWGTRSEAEARARNLVNGEGGGIGIELGDLGDGTSLGGIDLDTCRAPDGNFEAWAQEIIERFGSYTEVSPSGTGAKIFFLYRTAELPTVRAAIGGPQHGREFKRSNGKDHPPAIEVHVSNRYFAVTGQRLDDAPDSIATVSTDLLLWVLHEAGPAFTGTSAAASDYGSGTDNSRSAIAFRKGTAARRAGKTYVQMVEALLADPDTADWARTKGQANGERELRRIWQKSYDAPPPSVREFPVMPDEAFIGLPGDIARIVEPHTESDPAGLLLSAQVLFGNCIGRGPHYRVEATDHGTNLFVVKVGDSSKARKGTGEGRVLSFFRHVDDDWVSNRKHSGLSSGEGVIWAVRDPITKLAKEGKGAFATMVEETIDAGVADKRLLVIEEEFAGALRVMQREGNILSRILRDAWDRGDLATLTKNSPARANGACISIIGHITADELRRYLDRTEMANGFGNRFLFACVRRSKCLPLGGSLQDTEVRALAYHIRRAVNRARRIGQVTMAPETVAAWCEIYPELSADRPGLLGCLTARSEAQVVRLAMLYALWAGSAQIELDHLMAAVAVEQFCQDSVEYIFGDTLGDPVADPILAALRAAGPNGQSRTAISNLFSRNTSTNQITAALGMLARRRLAAQRETDAAIGRPPETWVATEWGLA